jgi:hypothetical protein
MISQHEKSNEKITDFSAKKSNEKITAPKND